MLIRPQDVLRKTRRSSHVADTIEWYLIPLTDCSVG